MEHQQQPEKQLSFWVEEELATELAAIAERNGESRNATYRRALMEFVERNGGELSERDRLRGALAAASLAIARASAYIAELGDVATERGRDGAAQARPSVSGQAAQAFDWLSK